MRHQYGEDDEQRIEHGNRAWFLEIVFTEEYKVGGKEQHEDKDIDGLSDDGGHDFLFRCTSPLHCLFETVQHEEGMAVNDVATIDDALPFQYHATGFGYQAEHVVHLRLAAFLVIDDVWFDEIVQIAALQYSPLRCQQLVLEQVLVGSDGRVEALCWSADSLFAVHDAHCCRAVFRHFSIVGRRHDALLVDFVQPLTNNVGECRCDFGEVGGHLTAE